MSYLQTNLKFLRKKQGLTQAQLGDRIGVKRAVIGTYEEGKAEPKLNTLRLLARFFNCTIHALIESRIDETADSNADLNGNSLRVLPVVVNAETNRENVSLVPIKASAGYLSGHADPDFVESLPQFQLPFPELSKDRTYRIFQTKGDSMLPLESGAYVIAEYAINWTELQDYKCCIVITKNDGVVYKRIVNKLENSQELILISDNKDYEPYKVKAEDILEVWMALGTISFNISAEKQHFINLQQIQESLNDIKNDLNELKSQR